MKRAEFERRYQVIRTVTHGAVQTHHAFASTGNVVMVHEIDPSAAQEAASLAGMIARLEDAERERILDVMEVDGTAMIVTRFLLEHETLRSWLEAAVGADGLPDVVDGRAPTPPSPPFEASSAPAPPGPDTPSGPTHDDGPGEFTRMFQAQVVPPQPPSGGVEPPIGDVGKEREAPGAPGERPEGEEVGEFTRMFKAVEPPPSPPPETPRTPAVEVTREPEASLPVGQAGGEVTRDRESPSAPPPPPGPSGPGEFTRMFQAVVATPEQVPDAERPPPAVQEPPAGGSIGAAPPPPPPPAPPPAPSQTGGAAHAGGTPPPENPTEPKGPGEFTRIFGAQTPPQSPPSPSAPSTPSAPSAKGGYPFSQEEEYRSRLGPTPASTPLPTPTRPPERDEVQAPGPLDLPRPPTAPPPPGEYTRIIQAVDRTAPGSVLGEGSPPGGPPGYPLPPGAAPGHPGGYPPPGSGGYPPSPQPGAVPYGVPPAPPPSRGPSRTLLIVGLVVIVVLVVALILFFALSGGDPATVPAEGVPEIQG